MGGVPPLRACDGGAGPAESRVGTQAEVPVLTGRIATAEEVFLLDWGRESWKKSVEQLSAGLQRMVTFNVALLGGSLAFLKDDVLPNPWKLVAMFLFFVSLSVALYGSTPWTEVVRIRDPRSVEAYKERLGAARLKLLKLASACLWLGLAVAAFGVLYTAAGSTP